MKETGPLSHSTSSLIPSWRRARTRAAGLSWWCPARTTTSERVAWWRCGAVDDRPFRSSFLALGDGRHKLAIRADLQKAIGQKPAIWLRSFSRSDWSERVGECRPPRSTHTSRASTSRSAPRWTSCVATDYRWSLTPSSPNPTWCHPSRSSAGPSPASRPPRATRAICLSAAGAPGVNRRVGRLREGGGGVATSLSRQHWLGSWSTRGCAKLSRQTTRWQSPAADGRAVVVRIPRHYIRWRRDIRTSAFSGLRGEPGKVEHHRAAAARSIVLY